MLPNQLDCVFNSTIVGDALLEVRVYFVSSHCTSIAFTTAIFVTQVCTFPASSWFESVLRCVGLANDWLPLIYENRIFMMKQSFSFANCQIFFPQFCSISPVALPWTCVKATAWRFWCTISIPSRDTRADSQICIHLCSLFGVEKDISPVKTRHSNARKLCTVFRAGRRLNDDEADSQAKSTDPFIPTRLMKKFFQAQPWPVSLQLLNCIFM